RDLHAFPTRRSSDLDEALSHARVIDDASPTDGERRANPTGNGKHSAARAKDDRIDLGRFAWRDCPALRGGKGRDVGWTVRNGIRSEEHTSELQSRGH